MAHNGRMNRRGKIVVAHIAVLAVLLVAFGLWWSLRGNDAAGRAGDPAADAVPAQAGAPEDAPAGPAPAETDDPSPPPDVPPGAIDAGGGEDAAVVLPPLDESDDFVRAWLEVRAAEVWTVWRVREDLVRLAAVLLEYAARGQVPRRSLSFITVGRFEVREEEGERIFIEPRSYARYNAVVEMALALPAEDAAALFALLEPLLAAALLELDASAPAPRALLERAVDHVLATPVLTEPVALTRQAVHYEFADPALEALAPLPKQLLRTGPANVGKAQQYAKRLRAALTPR